MVKYAGKGNVLDGVSVGEPLRIWERGARDGEVGLDILLLLDMGKEDGVHS